MKTKTGISFGEKVNKETAMDAILNLQDYTITLYEEQNTDIEVAHDETQRLIFSKQFSILNGLTPAHWIAQGGDEGKAAQAIKGYISDAVKEIQKQEEEKTVIAKVFGGGR